MIDPKIAGEKPAQWEVLAELEMEPVGDFDARANEAVEAVTEAVKGLDLPRAHLERMQAAVLRTCVRAMERGASQAPLRPVVLRALASQTLDPSQGWGFFLIERRDEGQPAVDGPDGNGQGGSVCIRPCVIIELFLYREGNRLMPGKDAPLAG